MQDDFGVVRADDALPPPVEYRFNVTLQPLAWARQYVFEAVALVGVILTQIDVWTNVDENRGRVAAIALVTAGALLFRRRAPFVAPLVVAAGALVFTLLDPDAAYNTDTMFLPLLLSCWAAGSLLDWRLALTALGAILVAGWTVFLRAPGVPWTELIWLSFPLIGIFVLSAAAGQALRAGPRGRGAGPAHRGGGAASGRGRAEPDHPRAARRARALGQRDDSPGERRPPAADAGAATRARGA